MYEICLKLNISYASIENIYTEFLKIANQFFYIPKKILFAAAIFSTCNFDKNYKSLAQICYVCECKIKHFVKKLKYLPLSFNFEFSCIIESFLHPLNLPFSKLSIINSKAIKISSKTDFAPKTCIAIAAYLYLKENKVKTSIPKLSARLGVSSMSMYRCLNRIDLK